MCFFLQATERTELCGLPLLSYHQLIAKLRLEQRNDLLNMASKLPLGHALEMLRLDPFYDLAVISDTERDGMNRPIAFIPVKDHGNFRRFCVAQQGKIDLIYPRGTLLRPFLSDISRAMLVIRAPSATGLVTPTRLFLSDVNSLSRTRLT